MARRSEHSQEEIKDMVLKAAENIVIEDGYGELKVRKIAMDIGYTVGSVYMVFENMANLIMHLQARTLDAIAETLTNVSLEQQADQKVIALAKAYLTFASENFNRWAMLFEHRLSESETLPDWYTVKIERLFQILEEPMRQMATGLTEHQIKQAARALWGGIHGVCLLSLTGKMDTVGVEDAEEALLLLVENFIRGWEASAVK